MDCCNGLIAKTGKEDSMSIKEDILKADDLPREKVYVEQWKMDVWIRSITSAERDDYEASLIQSSGRGRNMQVTPNLSNAKAKLVARALVDGDGKRIFTDAEAVKLGGKSARAISDLYAIAQRLSGLSDDDVEELVKNSESGQDEDSPSD